MMPSAASFRGTFCFRCVCRFVYFQDLICPDIFKRLHDAARPPNFDACSFRIRTEAKMDALVAGRKVASAGRDRLYLQACRRFKPHFRADRIAIALMTNQMKGEPVIRYGCFVVENVKGTVVCGDDCVDTSIVINVADGESARNPCLLKYASRICR